MRESLTDLEDLLLERSERFWAMIARARQGKAVSLDRAVAKIGLRKGTRAPGRAPRKR
jgi:hypothetical protein